MAWLGAPKTRWIGWSDQDRSITEWWVGSVLGPPGEFAIEQLVRTLSWQGALVVSVLGVSAPKAKTDDQGRFVNAETIAAIEQWTTAAIEAAGASPTELLRRVGNVVSPYGIDPARFGDLTR